MPELTCNRTRLYGGDPIVHRNRDELCALVERHGVSRDDTLWVEYDIIDGPLLRFGLYLRNPAGHIYTDPEWSPDIALTTVERPLVGELPSWWRPVPADAL